MEYSKIIAITGLPGLYEMMNSKGDGAIVRSLDDQSTKFVSGRVHQFTHLESIEVYTERENVNLAEVLNAMKDSGEKLPDEKDNKALEAYFKKVYPALDFGRVYASDMKKMVKWYNVLAKNNVDIKLSEPVEEEEEPAAQETAAAEAAAEKPAKKPKAKTDETDKAPAAVKAKETKARETKAKEEPKAKESKAKETKDKEAAPAKKAAKAAPAKKAAKKKEE